MMTVVRRALFALLIVRMIAAPIALGATAAHGRLHRTFVLRVCEWRSERARSAAICAAEDTAAVPRGLSARRSNPRRPNALADQAGDLQFGPPADSYRQRALDRPRC